MASIPDQYAVIGNPVSHSKSPRIHSIFAEQTGQSMEYRAILATPETFADTVKDFFSNHGKGMNVTVPFKTDAFRLCHSCSERAQRAGAVNTLLLDNDSNITGDNTDGVGLLNDLQVNLELDLERKTILVLGAGGAVRGILQPLLKSGIAGLHIANRTLSRAEELARDFVDLATITTSQFVDVPGDRYDVIINATSASLDNEVPPIPASLVSPETVCYDLMYSDSDTAFVRWAGNAGAGAATDGLGMLVEQAAESFYLWRGVRPKTREVIEIIRSEIRSEQVS